MPASLQEAMANDLHDQVKDEQFIRDAGYWSEQNSENIYPPGGWPDEPPMYEDRGMQIKKSGVPLNVSSRLQ